MKKINVMHLRSGSGKGLYGAESVIVSICKNIDKKNFDCVVVCFQDPRISKITLIDEAQIIGIPAEIIKLENRIDLSAVFKLRALLDKYDIDILHCHDYKANFIGLLASKSKEVKLVTTLHGWLRAGARERFYEYADSFLIKNFNQIIAISEDIKKSVSKSSILQKKTIVIHNAVDTDYFKEKIAVDINYKKKLKIEKNVNIIGTVGRLSAEKGQSYLIEAAKEVIDAYPDTVFLIAGEGLLKKPLASMVSSIGLQNHIIFTGLIPQNEMRKTYSLFDIFVLPSLREGFGLALIEAMAMGIPVTATNVGGIPEIIEDGKTGYLVPPADANAISKAVIALLSDKAKAESMAKAGQNFVREEASIHKFISRIEEVYRKLITK